MSRQVMVSILCLVMLSGMLVNFAVAQETPLSNFQNGQVLTAEQLNQLVTLLNSVNETQQALRSELSTLQADLAQSRSDLTALQNSLATVLANAALALGPFVSVVSESRNGVNGPNIIFSGANVHIQSGSGATDDGGNLTGLGNLVVGYNEALSQQALEPGERGGSHNLIVGTGHMFRQYGGFAAGQESSLRAAFAAVCGGIGNIAEADGASVSGGLGNVASGVGASVSGGLSNAATDEGASVSGGINNIASGQGASVTGGIANTSSGSGSSINGGLSNESSGNGSSVNGGLSNVSSGSGSSVNGGIANASSGSGSSVNGGLQNMASGESASVGGGIQREAITNATWTAGSLVEDF